MRRVFLEWCFLKHPGGRAVPAFSTIRPFSKSQQNHRRPWSIIPSTILYVIETVLTPQGLKVGGIFGTAT